MALDGAPGPDWAVAVMSGSRTVAHATSDAAGRFRFVLAPGRYTLECGQNRMVVVTAGRTVSTDCDVPVP
jgi:RES domain-containing protein